MKNRIIKIDEKIILEFQWIPPGEFLMGSPETENGHEESESPQHRVMLTSGFWMGKYPVTQQQWQTLMGFNPSKFVDMQHPVEMVNWNDAQKFILRFNELNRGTFRLPTEAEWEYACRCETTTRFYSGDSERDLDRVAWYAANSDAHPHPVGKKGPNSLGLYDMHGNVFEWTADWYGPYVPDLAVDPAGRPEGTKRVLRGGCCLCDPQNCRAANRYAKAPDGKNFNIGFRVVMSTESETSEKSSMMEKGKPTMNKIQVYDPPMCCSTGVCGPSVDEKLVRFAADLDRLKSQGFLIERYNLSQQPGEFVKNSLVKTALEKEGNNCLPIILFDGAVVHKGSYPARQELAALVGLSVPQAQKLVSAEVRELVAIGAAIACNCEMCFKSHYDKARKLGISDEDMLDAVEMGLKVKEASAQSIKELAYKYLKKDEKAEAANTGSNGCCASSNCC